MIYPMMIIIFLIPFCIGFIRPLNMKDIQTIYPINFITFFYICSEYTSLSKGFITFLSIFYTTYTILLALQLHVQLERFRGESPSNKDSLYQKKKKRKKRKSNFSEDKSKSQDLPPALRDKSELENVQKENGILKLEVKRLRTQSSAERKLRSRVIHSRLSSSAIKTQSDPLQVGLLCHKDTE